MNRTRTLRGLLGTVAVIVLATSGTALASGGASMNQAHVRSAAAVKPAGSCSPGAHACPIRINFAPGAYSAQGHSHLSNINSRKWFVVNVHAGQTMIVVVEGAGATRGVVHFPGGGSDGQPGGRVYDDSVPSTGDYLIRVNESPMGEQWSGGVDVVVVIY